MDIQEIMQSILTRELGTLRRELEAYEDEADLWRTPTGITNSAGTLALHLVGNLQSFVGAVLGSTGYIRDREAEFSRRNVSRDELLDEISTTAAVVGQTLTDFPAAALTEPFPIAFGDHRVQTADFLVHLATHLAYHVGQIDYHRRLITGENRSVGPLAISELASVSADG